MKIIRKYDDDYHEYYYLDANQYGLTHLLHDKIKDLWWLVHASTYQFPMKYRDGVVSGYIEFCV